MAKGLRVSNLRRSHWSRYLSYLEYRLAIVFSHQSLQKMELTDFLSDELLAFCSDNTEVHEDIDALFVWAFDTLDHG